MSRDIPFIDYKDIAYVVNSYRGWAADFETANNFARRRSQSIDIWLDFFITEESVGEGEVEITRNGIGSGELPGLPGFGSGICALKAPVGANAWIRSLSPM